MSTAKDSVEVWQQDGPPVVVLTRRTNSARDLRDALLLLAYEVDDRSGSAQGVCVLVNTRLSEARVTDELARFRRLLRSDIAGRLHVLISRPNHRQALVIDRLPDGFLKWLTGRIGGDDLYGAQTRGRAYGLIPARQAVIAVLYEIALSRGVGSEVRVGDLQKLAGVSYPTVTATLSPMIEQGLIRSDRGVVQFLELERADIIDQLRGYANSRKSRYFADPSGLMRPADLHRRFMARRQGQGADRFGHVQIGGVIGAAHYFPQLDISAPLRLDLEAPDAETILAQELDVGLQERSSPSHNVILALHPTVAGNRHRDQETGATALMAPAFDCLSDLVEMGYVREAREMVNYLLHIRARKQ